MKYYGVIGYGVPVEVDPENNPDVWEDGIIEKKYFGEVIKNYNRNTQNVDSVLDEIGINNQISIIADPYAIANFQYMKYISWNRNLWKITDIEVSYPRIIISLGGVYNGPVFTPFAERA